MKYSIDTSAILDAWVRYYPPTNFPSLWTKLDELVFTGQLLASEEVLSELEKKADDVAKWAKMRPQMFLRTDETVQVEVAGIVTAHPGLVDLARNRSTADPFVIAVAKVHGCTVVTAEQPKPSKPRIPDVCNAMGIHHVNVLGLIVREKWSF